MESKIDLARFVAWHEEDYETALSEIRRGKKINHWIWYIFPTGLWTSPISQDFAINGREETEAFLHDPYPGGHLTEIGNALMDLETKDANVIFERMPTDAKKLWACMTLFAEAAEKGSVFLPCVG